MPSLLPSLTTLLRLFSLLSVLTISSLAGLLYTYQGKLIYPSSLPAGSREDKTRPDAFRLPFEEEWLSTPDGEKLHAWYIADSPEEKRRSSSGDEAKTQRVVVIMFQANAGNMAHRLPIADVLFRKLGCEVAMFSYRGYGLSSGTPSERGIQVDAQVVLDWVRRRVQEEEGGGGGGAGGETKIVLYGQSLGGAVAISTASRNSASSTASSSSTTPGISGLILENTFTSIPSLIPSVLPPARFFTFLCRETWHSDLALSEVDPRMSILFLSGAKDELIPPRMMRELWGIAKRKAKGAREWVSLEKGTHNDTCMQRGYWDAVASFLQRRVGLDTDYSRQAILAGYGEERMCVGPQDEGGGEGEKRELVAEGSSEEEEYGDDWTEEKDVGSSTAAKAASAAGVRKRGGAGGAGPADVVDEEIETDGVRSARLGKL